MLELPDIRQSRLFKESKEEGLKEGKEEGLKEGMEKGIAAERQQNLQEKLRSVSKLAALEMSAETIADVLGLDVDLVRREIAKKPS